MSQDGMEREAHNTSQKEHNILPKRQNTALTMQESNCIWDMIGLLIL